MRWILLLIILMWSVPVWSGKELPSGQLLYVPVYSHIYTGDKQRPFNLAVTLSIRNIDQKHGLRLVSVDYYNTAGRLVRRLLPTPQEMGPLESVAYVINESDSEGGSGANFLVRWDAKGAVNPPIVESVMIGASSSQGISFVSPARVIEE